jgi:hypothetical protein
LRHGEASVAQSGKARLYSRSPCADW